MTARRGILLLVLILALPAGRAAAWAASTGGRMSADQVASLLKAGVGETVILRQVAATGTRLTLTVDQILMLKAAGATDRLLAALLGPDGSAGPAEPAADPAFRIYREKNDKGEEVLVVTNLDEFGRRIGGEIDHEAEAAARRAAAPAPEDRAPAMEPQEYDEAGGRQAPVIVNIYPPEAPSPDVGEPYGPSFVGGYWPVGYPVGYSIGYPAGWAPGALRHLRGHDFRGFHGMGGFAPRVDPGFFGRPSAINTQPYRHGDAAQRNRAAFHRH